MAHTRRFLVSPALARLIRKEQGTQGRVFEGYFANTLQRTHFVRHRRSHYGTPEEISATVEQCCPDWNKDDQHDVLLLAAHLSKVRGEVGSAAMNNILCNEPQHIDGAAIHDGELGIDICVYLGLVPPRSPDELRESWMIRLEYPHPEAIWALQEYDAPHSGTE
jgi:hypothetical protein